MAKIRLASAVVPIRLDYCPIAAGDLPGPAGDYMPSLDFSDTRNSQYLVFGIAAPRPAVPLLDFSDPRNSQYLALGL